MAKGGYYDVIKEGRIKPKLRILDCFGERCLLDLVTSPDAPGFDSVLYLVTIRDNALVGEMKQISPYGRATGKATFVALGVSKTPTGIYVTSQTHMGTRAEQLFDMNDLDRQIAIQTFYKKKLQEKEGAIKYFAKARQVLAKWANRSNSELSKTIWFITIWGACRPHCRRSLSCLPRNASYRVRAGESLCCTSVPRAPRWGLSWEWRTTMPIVGMNHFTVLAKDLEATKDFYVAVLGLV